MIFCRSIKIAIIFMVIGSFCYGQDNFGIDIHGFASQGYLRSTDNNYLGNSKDGSFEFNEVGINFQKELTENLRVGIQLFARDLGTQGNNEVVIDWALADYQWKTWLNVRIGKMKTPLGIYNQERDIDFLRTSILLPQSVYNEPQREIIGSREGVSFYGTFDLGKAGSLEYDLMAGSISTNGKAPFIMDPYLLNVDLAVAQTTAGFSVVPGFTGVDVITGEPKLDIESVYTFQLIYNSPLEGLRVGGSYTELRANFSGDFTLITNFANPNDPSGTLQISSVTHVPFSAEAIIRTGVFSMEYTKDRLTLSAEASLQAWWVDDVKVDAEIGGFYVAASYQFNDWLTLGAYYSILYEDLNNKDGDNLIAQGRDDFEAWQNDLALTCRFDINEYWVVKAEIHIMNGAADVSLSDNQTDDPLEEDWVLFAIKSTVSF